MSLKKFAVAKQKSYRISAAIVCAAMAGLVLSLGNAHSRAMYEPLGIVAQDQLVPGQDLPLSVTLEGPSSITVYSDPPGAVQYTGNLDSSSGTIDATTSSFVPNGPVTVYLETDGATVVATTTNGGPPQNDGIL